MGFYTQHDPKHRPDPTEPRVRLAKVTAALPQLEKLANQIIADGHVPGLSIAVVYQDKVVYLKGFGVKKAGEADPARADNEVDDQETRSAN